MPCGTQRRVEQDKKGVGALLVSLTYMATYM